MGRAAIAGGYVVRRPINKSQAGVIKGRPSSAAAGCCFVCAIGNPDRQLGVGGAWAAAPLRQMVSTSRYLSDVINPVAVQRGISIISAHRAGV